MDSLAAGSIFELWMLFVLLPSQWGVCLLFSAFSAELSLIMASVAGWLSHASVLFFLCLSGSDLGCACFAATAPPAA